MAAPILSHLVFLVKRHTAPESHLCVCAQVRDARGRRVGRCKEWAKVVGDDQVDARVLAMRHKDLPYMPKLQKATKPERVMTYRSALLAYCVVSGTSRRKL